VGQIKIRLYLNPKFLSDPCRRGGLSGYPSYKKELKIMQN
jgi:hypothetical protein